MAHHLVLPLPPTTTAPLHCRWMDPRSLHGYFSQPPKILGPVHGVSTEQLTWFINTDTDTTKSSPRSPKSHLTRTTLWDHLHAMATRLPTLPSLDDLPLSPDHPPKSAWGLWGDSKEASLGSLNYLTEELVLKTVKEEVRTGERVGLKYVPIPVRDCVS